MYRGILFAFELVWISFFKNRIGFSGPNIKLLENHHGGLQCQPDAGHASFFMNLLGKLSKNKK